MIYINIVLTFDVLAICGTLYTFNDFPIFEIPIFTIVEICP